MSRERIGRDNSADSHQQAKAGTKAKACQRRAPRTFSPEESQRLAEELRVHQTALQKQNEELLRGQAELEATRARYLDLYDRAPAGYFTLNERGVILEANLTAAALLGVSRYELLTQRLTRFILSEDQDTYHRNCAPLLDSGVQHVCEIRMLRAGAPPFWVRFEAFVVQAADGAPVYQAIASEITDRKRAEEALESHRIQLRAIYDHVPVMLCLLNRDRDVLFANRAFADYAGRSEDELMADRACGVLGCIHALDDPRGCGFGADCESCSIRSAIEFTFSTGGSCHDIEHRTTLLRNGNPREAILRGTTAHIETAGQPNVLLCLDDVTERARAENALRESEQRYRRIAEGLTDYLYTVRIEGGRAVETMHGAACETVTGYTAEEFASDPCLWMNMIEEGDRARVLESFSRLLDGEYVPPVEHRIIRKDGQVRWVIDTPVLRLDDDGKPLSYDGVIQDVTARKRAEDELKAASRYSRNLIEASLDPLVTIDAGGQITDVNAATETVTGVSRERLIGSDFASYFTEPEKARAVYRMVFEQGQVRDYPLTIRHTSSALADVLYNASVYRSEDGEVLGVFAAARDITERKRIEDGLRKSEARFLSYFYLPLHGIAITSVEKGWIQVNDRICSILGYRRDEIVRMTWAEMTHPDDLAADVEQFERVLSGQIEQYQMEKRFIRKDGVVVWTDLAVGCVRNPDGSVDYIIALLQDISKRKQAEEMNSRLADIVRYSDDAIISKNLNGIIASWNKGAERVYGYGEAEILGKPITLLFPPGCYEELNGFLATVAHGEHVERYETVRRRKDGTDIDVSITISPVRNAEGAIVGASTIARDITERKRAADALLRLKSLLEITQRVTKVGGWEYNVVTRRMIWTDEVYRIHELTREYDPYNIDQNIQFYAPEDRAIIARAFQRAVSEGEPYDLELKFTTAGGRDLWVRTIGRADKIEDEVRRVYGNIMDITDRKHAEASLRESEERFKGAFQHSAIGMALVSPEGRWLKVNARFCSMVGYSEEELFAKTFQNITHPDDLDADLNYVRQMLDGTIETYSMEKRYFHKDGHIVWVLLSVALVRDSFGAPVHFVSQARDITRRKLAEAEENLAHAILDAANRQSVLSELLSEFVAAIQSYTGCKGVGIRILEKDGAIPYQAYCGFTREFYEMESPLSIHVDECMCIYVIEGKTDASRPFFTAYGSFFMNGTTKFLASVSDTDKGKTRNACNRQGYESVALIPIRSNEVISGLIHLADPRENMVQAHVVEAMERISSLMGTAIQRTIAETELHAALSEKTLLLREVHHRVKNNLAAIIGLLDLQRRSMGDVPTPAVLGGLADRIKSMALVHEHLYRNADLVHIDFEEYLKALTSHLTSSLGTRSSLHCTISVTKIEMGLDLAIPCGMIVNELVTNALKHAFPGGAPRPGASCCELTVSMTRDGATYTLIVADNGVGFPADFDWTAAKSLGLRLVRMLGEHQLGASITVDGTNGTQIELKFGAGT